MHGLKAAAAYAAARARPRGAGGRRGGRIRGDEPAIQTFTPRSAKQITNIDVLRQQIRNHYGDPLGTGVFSPDSSYAQETEGVAAYGSRLLAHQQSWPFKHHHHRNGARQSDLTKAIVLDVDDTTLATWNYEIFSNWAFNPTTARTGSSRSPPFRTVPRT